MSSEERNGPNPEVDEVESGGGDPQAAPVEELLQKYIPIVHRAVTRRMGRVLRSREESLDLVQSVCRRALEQRALDRVDDEKRFLAWLLRIVERKVVDRYREASALKRKADGPNRELPEESPDGSGSEPTPSVVVARRETIEAVRAAIRRLPPELGRALELNEYEGLSYDRIAEELAITPKQARVRVGKAKLLLAHALKDE